MKKITKSVVYLLAGIFANGCNNCEPFIVAHRGNSSVAPENTIAAYRSAWENGFKYIEIDVHSTADDNIICLHDKTLTRVSQNASTKNVSEMTIEEIKQFDVGSWKDQKFAGEKTPTLEELFSILPTDVSIVLEIKSVNDNFPLKLVDLMTKYNISKERIIIISFSEHALRNLNKLTPGFKTNFLIGLDDLQNDPSKAKMTAEELIAKLQDMSVTGVDARVGIALDRDYIQKVKSAGLDFHVWTIDNPDNAVRLKNAGVTSITTNRPIEIRKALFNK